MPVSYHLRRDNQIWQWDLTISCIDVEVTLTRLLYAFDKIRHEPMWIWLDNTQNYCDYVNKSRVYANRSTREDIWITRRGKYTALKVYPSPLLSAHQSLWDMNYPLLYATLHQRTNCYISKSMLFSFCTFVGVSPDDCRPDFLPSSMTVKLVVLFNSTRIQPLAKSCSFCFHYQKNALTTLCELFSVHVITTRCDWIFWQMYMYMLS